MPASDETLQQQKLLKDQGIATLVAYKLCMHDNGRVRSLMAVSLEECAVEYKPFEIARPVIVGSKLMAFGDQTSAIQAQMCFSIHVERWECLVPVEGTAAPNMGMRLPYPDAEAVCNYWQGKSEKFLWIMTLPPTTLLTDWVMLTSLLGQ